jgi:hypothetical protein
MERTDAALKTLTDRVQTVENKPANNVDAEALKKHLDDHPVIVEFRTFLDKWGSKSTANV